MGHDQPRSAFAFRRSAAIGAAAWAVALAAQPAYTQAATQPFDVPSQSLGAALLELGRQAHISIAAPRGLIAGKTSAAVTGTMTTRDALRTLLKGSGLGFRFVNATAVRVTGRAEIRSDTQGGAAGLAVDGAGAASAIGLEDIIVTARRREEVLQHVPAAVTAFTAADLRARRIETAQDVQQFVPSMAVYSFGGQRDGTTYALRGQSTTTGATAGVVVYLNEVPLASDQAISSSGGGPGLYLDLETLAVVNGPQGTLFGRNTTGGALLFQSKRPTDRLEGYLVGGYGNHDNRELEGAVNIPMVDDKVLLRVAGRRQLRDGYTRNIVDGDDLDNRNNWAARVTLTLRPSELFENDIIYFRTHSKSHGTSRQITLLNPAPVIPIAPGFAVPISALFPTIGQELADQQARGIRSVANDAATAESAGYWSITDIAQLNVSDDIVLKNIVAYQSIKSRTHGDADGTSLPILAPFFVSHTSTVSEELQLQGKSLSGHLSWTVGGFIDSSKPIGSQILNLSIFGGAVQSNLTVGTRRHSRALYAQGSYDLGGLSPTLERLSVTAGYRYTWDRRSDFQTSAFGTVRARPRSSAGTWTLGLDYQADDTTLVYVKTSRGYKAGGFNPSSLNPAFLTFKPEYVQDVEAGLKKDWGAGPLKLRTNIDAFHTKYSDIQKSVVADAGLSNISKNVAGARINGIEFSGQLFAGRYLEISGNYSYLDAKYTRSATDPATSLPLFDVSLPFTYTPKNKYSVTGRLHAPVDDGLGEVGFAATYSHISGLFIASNREPGDTIHGYGLLNLRADWTDVGGRPLDLGLFMTNATNRKYIISSTPIYAALGFTPAVFGEPRMYGVQLRVRFGADRSAR